MPIQLNGATSGSTTVQATDAVTATLTLPSATGTLLSTANPQSGGVIQTVSSTSNYSASTASTSFGSTSITASITPKFSTSKILVTITTSFYNSNAFYNGGATIYRNSTNLSPAVYFTAPLDTNIHPMSVSTLDSPATTSSTTYTLYIKTNNAATTFYVGDSNGATTITLQEIAA